MGGLGSASARSFEHEARCGKVAFERHASRSPHDRGDVFGGDGLLGGLAQERRTTRAARSTGVAGAEPPACVTSCAAAAIGHGGHALVVD
jgi:hypothetical protein